MRTLQIILCLTLAFPLFAQEITVNPNRPTFATPAATTQEGVLEVEYGLQRTTFRDTTVASQTPALLKWGAGEDFEFRFSSPGLMKNPDGVGDFSLGAQWCCYSGAFDQAFQVTHKFVTANAGVTSGHGDTMLMAILSKSTEHYHLDTNILVNYLGTDTGVVRQPAATISLTRTLTPKWTVTSEVYAIGGTRLGEHIVSNLWCVAYSVSKRLVLDTGVDMGLTHGAPRYSILVGLTYGIARIGSLR